MLDYRNNFVKCYFWNSNFLIHNLFVYLIILLTSLRTKNPAESYNCSVITEVSIFKRIFLEPNMTYLPNIIIWYSHILIILEWYWDSVIKTSFYFTIYCTNKCDNTNFWFLVSYIAGQQQHFRPFFDTRFTGHLLELRRKSDPFTMAGANPQGKKHHIYLKQLLNYHETLPIS